MLAEVLRRLMATIPVMVVVAIAVFALLHVTPGDPAVIIAGDYATDDDIARIRAKLGLDRPFLTQVGIWLAQAVIYMALVARMTRASMLGVLGEDYIRTAFAKGLPPGRVLVRHALKNASLPVVTIIGIGFALLIGGAVVTESVFALPGLGR